VTVVSADPTITGCAPCLPCQRIRHTVTAIATSSRHLGTLPALGEGPGMRADRQPFISHPLALPLIATCPLSIGHPFPPALYSAPGWGRGLGSTGTIPTLRTSLIQRAPKLQDSVRLGAFELE